MSLCPLFASGLDVLRSTIVDTTHSLLSLNGGGPHEARVVELAQLKARNSKRRNHGLAGGHSGFVSEPHLIHLGCRPSYPITCYLKDLYRTISGACNNLQNEVNNSNHIQ